MPTPKRATVFDTNGKLLDVDPNDLESVLNDGAERAVDMYDPTHPTTKHWTVRQSDVPDALKDGAYILNPEDFTRNDLMPTPQGTYKMLGPGGKNPVPVPYSMIGSAAKNGYVMDAVDRERYLRDAAADPALKDIKLRPGVKAAGRNTAGQVMVAPDMPEKPGAWASLGNTLAQGAMGVAHLIDPAPNQEELQQAEKSGPIGKLYDAATWLPQRLVRPNFTESQRADEEKQAGNNYEATMHAAASGVPFLGPMAEGMREGFAQDESTGTPWEVTKSLAGSGVGNALLIEAPHLAAPLGDVLTSAAKSAGFRDAVHNLPGIDLAKKTQGYIENFGKESEDVRKNNQAAEEQTLNARGEVEDANQKAQQQYSDDLNAHNQKVANLKKKHENTIAQNQQKHADALQAHQDLTKQTQAENIKAQQNHISTVEQIARDKEAAQGIDSQRQMLQNRAAINANELQKRIDTAESDAKTANDQAWNAWRDKLNKSAAESGQQQAVADMSPVVKEINDQSVNMTPSQVTQFRDILKQAAPEAGGVTELQKLRNDIAKNNFGGTSYDELSPKKKEAADKMVEQVNLDLAAQAKQGGGGQVAGLEVPASRLHGWKSELERAVRNTEGNVQHAVGQVLDRVRELEVDVSKKYGADAELAAARKLHGPYVENFVNSPNQPSTNANTLVKDVHPDYASTNKLLEKGKNLGGYDPKIPELVQSIQNDLSTIKQLPSESKVREMMSQQPPEPPKPKSLPKPPMPPLPPNEPVYPQPPKPPDLKEYKQPKPTEPLPDAADIGKKMYNEIHWGLRKYGGIGPWVLRSIIGGEAINMLFHGHLSTFGTTMLIGQTAVSLITHALRRESVLKFLAQPTAEELKMLDSLSGPDQARVRQVFGALAAKDAERLGGKPMPSFNPRMAQFLLGSAVGQKQPTLADLKKEAEERKPDLPEPEQQAAPNEPEPEEEPGPQSNGAKPVWTHVFDENTGRIVPV